MGYSVKEIHANNDTEHLQPIKFESAKITKKQQYLDTIIKNFQIKGNPGSQMGLLIPVL